jgi:hypothetical protein
MPRDQRKSLYLLDSKFEATQRTLANRLRDERDRLKRQMT